MKRHWLVELVSRNTFHRNLVENSLNQYCTVTSGGVTDTLSYDPWGDLTNTRPFSYRYYENPLCNVYTNRTNGPYGIGYYEYDAEKRRRRKTMSSQDTRYFIYSGWTLVCETLTTNRYQLTTYYVWGRDLSGTFDGAGGVGGLLATEVGGVWYFPLYDNNGNVTDYVSETGEVVASYTYDAFGRTIAQSGAMADVFPFRFSTKYYDAEANLYYYGYRFYSPELGRWLNRDPIEEDGGDNLYAFCGNNGMSYIDARGKNPLLIIGGFILLIATNPDTANAPGIGDAVEPSLGMYGMMFDVAAGRAITLVLKGCGIVLGKVKFMVWQIKAEKARNLLAKTATDKAVAIGAFDARTGQRTAATSAKYIPEPTPVLKALSEELGGVGAKPFCDNAIGCCAEFHAADDLIRAGSVLSDIRFTKAIRPRIPDKLIPTCENCLKMFEHNFNSGSIPVKTPDILFVPTAPLFDDSHDVQ